MSRGPIIIKSDGSRVPGRTVRAADWSLNFAPCDLTFVRIDQQTRLQFGKVEVTIETAFSLELNGRRYDLDPEHRAGLGPLLSVYPSTLVAAMLDDDGTLHLSFDNDAAIAVRPDRAYESWQIGGPSSALVVCTPGDGGSLAVWD